MSTGEILLRVSVAAVPIAYLLSAGYDLALGAWRGER